jgi:hypothetical protein
MTGRDAEPVGLPDPEGGRDRGRAVATVLAALSAPRAATATAAATIVVLESLQQVFSLQPNWLSYRATAETLQ